MLAGLNAASYVQQATGLPAFLQQVAQMIRSNNSEIAIHVHYFDSLLKGNLYLTTHPQEYWDKW